jgi:transmembrane sensor
LVRNEPIFTFPFGRFGYDRGVWEGRPVFHSGQLRRCKPVNRGDVMIRAMAGASAAERQAIDWLTVLQDPESDVDRFTSFQAWLDAKPDHRSAYERVEGLWHELSRPELRQAYEGRARPFLTTRRAATFGGFGAIAASVAAVLITVGFQPREAIYTAPQDHGQEVVLKDGTSLSLKAGAQVKVRLGAHKRDAVLARGEALFDVAHDTARPFKVKVGDHQIDVLGTAFDVRRRADGFQVTVLRGLVRVSPQSGGDGVAMAKGDHYDHLSLTNDVRVVKGEPQDLDEWKAGRRVYRNSPLSAVMADLNTSLDKPVILASSAADIRFSGILQMSDDAAVLRQLEAVLPIRIRATSRGPELDALKP